MKKTVLCILLFFLLLAIAGLIFSQWIESIASDTQQTIVLGRTIFSPESKGSLRVMMYDRQKNSPISAADVQVSLVSKENKETILTSQKTRENGNADISFQIPSLPEGSYKLRVSSSSLTKDVQEMDVQIKKDYKILLNTDKPLYQPGQTIHIRSLTLNKSTLKPVKQGNVTIEALDAKGNKVFKHIGTTSDFGLASCDFVLASEVNEGTYKIKATVENAEQEKDVTVRRYVLPKFKITAELDHGYYMPGQTVRGKLSSHYFFGKPVQSGNVKITIFGFDVEWHEYYNIQVKTNEDGQCEFEFELPKNLWGIPLLKGDAIVRAELKVTDTAEHTETIAKDIIVSGQTIHIVAIPESSKAVLGIQNTVYICTMYPDRTPAITRLNINGKKLSTNSLGIAECKFVPEQISYFLNITAIDAQGMETSTTVRVSYETSSRFFIALDKPVYKAGEVVKVQVISNKADGNFYLDLIKERQTILTQTLEKKDGKYESEITLPQDVSGTLLLDVYQVEFDRIAPIRTWQQRRWDDESDIQPTTTDFISRDTRVIFVSPSNDLKISAAMDKDVYRPGSQAMIDFTVSDSKEIPKESVLSVSIVDESVFFLQEMQPGLEKVYFMLQQELLKPKYQIYYTPPVTNSEIISLPGQLDKTEQENAIKLEKSQAVKVMFAMAKVKPELLTKKDSYPDKLAQVEENKELYRKILYTSYASLPFVILCIVCIAAILGLYSKNRHHKDEHYQMAKTD